MSTSVKNFRSGSPGAPVLSGQAGAMLSLLKALLKDGYGATAATSLTVASGVATLEFGGTHPFFAGAVAEVSGADTAGLLGQFRVTSVTGTAAEFSVPGVPDVVDAGVSISAKMAAAGWVELFSGTHISALAAGSVEATGCVLRIDDTGTTLCRVVAYESMTDISTGVNAFPLETQVAGGGYWPKSNAADASARAWSLYADDRSFLLHISPHQTYQSTGVVVGFGDYLSRKPANGYGAFLSVLPSNSHTTTTAIAGCLGFGNAATDANALFVPRVADSVPKAQLCRKASAYNSAAKYSGEGAYNINMIPCPNPAGAEVLMAPVEIVFAGGGLLGAIPGLMHTPQTAQPFVTHKMRISGQGPLVGRAFDALHVGPAAAGSVGAVFVDAAGPWR